MDEPRTQTWDDLRDADLDTIEQEGRALVTELENLLDKYAKFYKFLLDRGDADA